MVEYIVYGRVVELADTLALGANARKSLRVQVPPRPLDLSALCELARGKPLVILLTIFVDMLY